jgi:hypothetical protein
MTSKRLAAKITRTPRSAASNLTALCFEPNLESRRFTLLNCLKGFRNVFTTMPEKAAMYLSGQNAAQEQLRKQQEETTRQQTEATARRASTPVVTPLPQNKTPTVDERLHRIGAICRDGSESGATGRGACSHHGGVKCWKYSDGTCHK